jgi:glutaconate CoA-transferase subunit B
VIIFMQQEKKRFVEKVDYLSSVGWLRGGDSRRRAGYTRGGPMAVVTNLGVMKFEEDSRRMYLAEVYPGVTAAQVAENTGFALDVSRAAEAAPPSPEEIRILRRDVDPQRLILGPLPA